MIELFKKNKLFAYGMVVLIVIVVISAIVIFSSTHSYQDMPSTGLKDSEILNCITSTSDDLNNYLNNLNFVADNNGLNINPYKIKVKNSCSAYLTYNIIIKINSTNYDLNNLYFNITESNYKLDSINNINSLTKNNNNYLLYTGDLNANESKVIDLRLWSNVDTTNMSIKASVKVSDLHTASSAPHGWYSSKEETLLNKIKSNNVVTKTLTTPGKEVSKTKEKVLSSTTDDEGTSYYYRGNIDNNYVIFANKCFRIVRITGAGSIKLVLYNDNIYNAPNPCNFGLDESTAAFAKYTDNTYQSIFNSKINDNKYSSLVYDNNKNKSIILKNLENWYLNNMFSYDYYLANQTMCVDKGVSLSGINDLSLNDDGKLKFNTWFKTSERIINTNPSLKCNSKYVISTSNGLTYKVGLLTADEVAFAGGIYNDINTNYYLYHNANGNNYWTVSPALYYNGANIWRVGTNGGLYYSESNNSYAIRPVISLKSNIKATGNGTSDNPYTISLK